MDQLRIDTTHRHAVQDPADYRWAAGSEVTERHAFAPTPDGTLPGRAACGLRWTAAYGKGGSGWCQACVAVLRDQLRATLVALAAAGIRLDIAERAVDDHRGDHFVFPAGVGR